MIIKLVQKEDAGIIHDLMIRAFSVYKDETPTSSALDETVDSILLALKDGEQGLIGFIDQQPVGMVRFRFRLTEGGCYFYRLSVLPDKQGLGIAKELLASLEQYAIQYQVKELSCKVRMSLPKNIHLYRSIGFEIVSEEVSLNSNLKPVKVALMKKQLSNVRLKVHSIRGDE